MPYDPKSYGPDWEEAKCRLTDLEIRPSCWCGGTFSRSPVSFNVAGHEVAVPGWRCADCSEEVIAPQIGRYLEAIRDSAAAGQLRLGGGAP